ncbi:MAG: BT_3928 family protein [Cytophagaceae bacterium]
MKLFLNIIRLLVGGLFIFSGAVKLNDPYGTAYKLEEYFHVFSTDFGSVFQAFIPYSLLLSIIICGLEVILGVALLINYKIRKSSAIALGLVIYFTFLTFYSFYFDKVKECGCFGTFIVLTAKQSFYKDLILLAFVGVIFIFRSRLNTALYPLSGNLVMVISTVLTFGFGYYTAAHLPVFDTLNFKVGADIPSLITPEERPVYKYVLEKEGKEFEFLQENYPSDPSYNFVRYILLNKDSTKLIPKITNYVIEGEDGDISKSTLIGKKLLITFPDPYSGFENCKDDCLLQLRNLITLAEKEGIQPMLVLKHMDASEVESLRHESQLSAPYYFADDVLLKMMVRSNPGIILLNEGKVKGKWHYNDIPEINKIKYLIK